MAVYINVPGTVPEAASRVVSYFELGIKLGLVT